jgi:hypothetical protein
MYPDFLIYSTDSYEGTGGLVAVDKWLPSDQNYAIYIFSYDEGVNPALEFIARVTSDNTVQVAGLEVRKLVGTGLTDAEPGTLIHIGAINHKGRGYMLIYSSGSQAASPDSLAIFDQMVATFTFTN